MSKVRMQVGIVVGLCARELGVAYADVTAARIATWSMAHVPDLFPIGLTIEQAQYIIDNPTALANDDPPAAAAAVVEKPEGGDGE